jgi:hypothetical protein
MFRHASKIGLEQLEDRQTPGGGIWDGGDSFVTYEPPATSIQIVQLPGDEVMLNSQPLPPKGYDLPGDEVMLNPQPLPPRYYILLG